MAAEELFEQYRATRSIEIRNEIFQANLGFAVSLAARYSRLDRKEIKELIQDASLGLISAIERFDPGSGVPFLPYAKLRIRGAIVDGLRRRDHLPRGMRKKLSETQQAAPALVGLSDVAVEPAAPSGGESGLWKSALKPLGKKDRLVVLMYFRLGLPLRECGSALGVSEVAASRRLDRSVRRMQGFFKGVPDARRRLLAST